MSAPEPIAPDEIAPRMKPLFSKVYGFSQELTRFLSNYDLGKADDPSLRTEDIALDLLRTSEMQAIKAVLREHLSECRTFGDGPTLPDSVREWALS